MACFVVSAVEAVVVTVAEKVEKKRELRIEKESVESGVVQAQDHRIALSRKLSWLKYMLWGGVILLAFEHVWHGEVVPWFPFLTAMSSSESALEMFKEMATVGVSMAALITAVWIGICFAADAIVKRQAKEEQEEVAQSTTV
ncbi:MAG: hypothetical protein K6E10_01100 [Eubacterium sp.]|nr:hypothetical protein [Eubacterium sp.]